MSERRGVLDAAARPLQGRRGVRGFTLAETLVALAITSLVAAVVVTRMGAPSREGDVAAVARSVSGLAEGVQAFRGDVGRYPADLAHLAAPPASALDACGRAIPAHFLAEWRGPYVGRGIAGRGIPVGGSTISTALRRAPAGVTGFGTLAIEVVGVEQGVADRLEESFDGNADLAGGTITWSASGDGGSGTLHYAFPVRGC